MYKKNKQRCRTPAQLNRAAELQTLILYYYPTYVSKNIYFENHAWDFKSDFDSDENKVRQFARSKGFQEDDFRLRNHMIQERAEAIIPIKNLHRGLQAIYITSSNYYNNPLRRNLNNVQQQIKTPLTIEMKDVIKKFKRESEVAAYSWGSNIERDVIAMRSLGNLSIGFTIMLLKNLLLERKKPAKSYRGYLASSQFLDVLDYYSKNQKVVTIDQFFSTTKNISIAHKFASGDYDSIAVSTGDKKVIFIIEGKSGAEISAWLNESEVLYPPETYFQFSPTTLLEQIYHLNAKVYKLKEVSRPQQADKTPYLIDTAKLQRIA